jgi:hypothetical protein
MNTEIWHTGRCCSFSSRSRPVINPLAKDSEIATAIIFNAEMHQRMLGQISFEYGSKQYCDIQVILAYINLLS